MPILHGCVPSRKKIVYKGMKDIEVTFPVIADLKMEVAKKFGMVQPNAFR